MKRKYLSIIVFSAGLFLAASILSNFKIFAKTCTWNGSQGGEWSNGNNWDVDCGGMEPANGDDLVFPATATTYIMNNFATATHFNSFNFYSGSYTVSPTNAAGISNGIYTHGTKPTIGTNLILDSDLVIESALIQNIDINGHDLTLDSTGGEVQVSSPITGTGNVTVTGGGIVNLEAWNTFDGTLDVKNNTTLKFFHTAGLSDSTPTIEGGSTLYYTGPGNLTVTNNINFGDNSTLKSDGDLNVFSGDINDEGFLNVNIATSTSTTLSGALTVTGLIKEGEGQLVLSGSTDNTMDGVVISNGDLLLDKTSAIAVEGEISINGSVNTSSLTNNANNQIPDSSQVLLSGANASWNLDGFDETIAQLLVTSGSVTAGNGNLTTGVIFMDGGVIDAGTGSVNLTGNAIVLDYSSESQGVITGAALNFAQNVTIARFDPLTSGSDLLIDADINSNFDLTVQGVFVTLAGDNSNLDGQINVGGIDETTSLLVAKNSNPLGAGNKTVVNGNATLLIDSSYTNINEAIELNGIGAGYLGDENFGALVFNGTGTSYTVSQVLQISSHTKISVLGDNHVEFNGFSDSFGGHEIWFAGPATPLANLPQVHMNDFFAGGDESIFLAHIEMYLDSPASLSSTSTVTFDNVSKLNVIANHRLAGISGDGYLVLGNHNLDLSYDNATYTFGGQITGSGIIYKTGNDATGQFKITANQPDFTGNILISFGKVFVNGNMENATVTLDGGILGGNGVVGTVTVNSGEIAPGNSPGIITINNDLILNSSSVLTMEITGPNPGTGYDQINVIGNIDLGGATLVLIVDPSFVPAVGSQLNLLTATGTITGNYGNLTDGAKITAGNVVYQIHYTSTGIYLTVISNTLANTGISIPSSAIAAVMFISLISSLGVYRKYYFKK